MRSRGWDALDVLLITGDAYVDHPSFGAALIGRVLEDAGYRVGIVAQPRWDRPDDIMRLGRPRLFAGITAGALDSMLAHYTAFRKLRHDDAYTPGNLHGARPNRACIVYTGLVRNAFPGLPVVLGGIEASMRRQDTPFHFAGQQGGRAGLRYGRKGRARNCQTSEGLQKVFAGGPLGHSRHRLCLFHKDRPESARLFSGAP